MNPAIELTLNQAFDFLLHVAVVRPMFAAPGRTHWGFPSIDAHACGKMPN